MTKRSDDLINEALVVSAEAPHLTAVEIRDFLRKAHSIGSSLHRIYERQCNGHQKPNGDWDEDAAARDDKEVLESRLRKLFADHKLGLYLQGDPRGSPVGIHTPKSGRYNTMGGRECGWRL